MAVYDIERTSGSNANVLSQGLASRFVRTYTTFSGIDITAMFDDRTMLTVSGVSCSITREKAKRKAY